MCYRKNKQTTSETIINSELSFDYFLTLIKYLKNLFQLENILFSKRDKFRILINKKLNYISLKK